MTSLLSKINGFILFLVISEGESTNPTTGLLSQTYANDNMVNSVHTVLTYSNASFGFGKYSFSYFLTDLLVQYVFYITVMDDFDIAVSEADGGIEMGAPTFELENKQIYELQGCKDTYKKCYSTDVSMIYNVSVLT